MSNTRSSAIHGKSDWLRMRNKYSAHAQKILSGQSSRSLPQARRIVCSGDENGSQCSLIIWFESPDDSSIRGGGDRLKMRHLGRAKMGRV